MAAALLPLLLPLLVPGTDAQAYDAADRSESAFSYVQPLNTTILGAYGHSPPVLPSRKPLPSNTAIGTNY
jgi:beta-glucosidase